MLVTVLAGLTVLAVVCAAGCGRMDAVSQAVLQAPGQAVELTLTLLGSMAFWNGLMAVAKEAGVTRFLSRLLRPVTQLLFRGLPADAPALSYITMNMAANLLGLGNAATPFGVAAMQELWKEAGKPAAATGHMVTLAVLNTASLQLVPTTVALLRSGCGAAAPLDILPAVLATSAAALTAALTAAKAGRSRSKTGRADPA